jgi:hypothetical protein
MSGSYQRYSFLLYLSLSVINFGNAGNSSASIKLLLGFYSLLGLEEDVGSLHCKCVV